ncbi:RNase A-like domain-containing protein [Buttiauxella sp. S19-1]|uniref:RNase A-like domain-containing protein n=1 Tax=Buttiauxella sp. S19-1 TaxID=941430 RepID=UPI00307FE3DE
MEKHVGKSDAELIVRFKEEPRLSASSSFYDADTADRAIGNGIAANKQQLTNWLAGDQERLVLQHEEKFSVGQVIQKGTEASHPSNKITIVIDKDPLMPNGYRVHTAYPK